MGLTLTRLAGLVLVPSNILLLLGLAGLLLLMSPYRRQGIWALTFSIVSLAIMAFSPISTWMAVGLETRFPKFVADQAPVAGIVVLGGSLEPKMSADWGQPIVNNAGERVIYLSYLARAYPSARIIFTGDGSPPEAGMIEAFGPVLGLQPGRTEFDKTAENTFQNACNALKMAQPKPGERWLLVTSAYHMPRAIGVFRKAGFPVVAFPVDYRIRRNGETWEPILTASNGLMRFDVAVREYASLAAYRLMGRTGDLLPDPSSASSKPGLCDAEVKSAS